jgi:tRNA threonylcarbamoyladenosine biosynthesis protein TsaE
LRQSLSVATVSLPDATATAELAARVAALLPAALSGWTILLQGDLGAGKSTFARAMLHAMGYKGAVPSPTYTLVEPYQLANNMIYHIDLYRIVDPDELEFLGWSDMQDGLRLIEWPERVPQLKDAADALLSLSYAGEGRVGELSALTTRAREAFRPGFSARD